MYLNRCTNPSKFTLPGFDGNFANLCTAKLKLTLIDNTEINEPMQALYLTSQILNLFTTGICISLMNIISDSKVVLDLTVSVSKYFATIYVTYLA